MRRASSGKRSPTSSVVVMTWRTARNHCDCIVIAVDAGAGNASGAGAAWRLTCRRGALGRRTIPALAQSGHATSPFDSWATKSSSDPNQPSNVWPSPQRRSRTFIAALSSGGRCRGVPAHRPAAGAPVLQPEQADQGLGVGELTALRRGVELVEAGVDDVEELAGIEPRRSRRQAAREPDLDPLGRIG